MSKVRGRLRDSHLSSWDLLLSQHMTMELFSNCCLINTVLEYLFLSLSERIWGAIDVRLQSLNCYLSSFLFFSLASFFFLWLKLQAVPNKKLGLVGGLRETIWFPFDIGYFANHLQGEEWDVFFCVLTQCKHDLNVKHKILINNLFF